VKAFIVLSFCYVLVIGSKDWVCTLETFNWCVCSLLVFTSFCKKFHFPMYFLQDVYIYLQRREEGTWLCCTQEVEQEYVTGRWVAAGGNGFAPS
jgi:hypothetical protein